jgi:hypothetical protein
VIENLRYLSGIFALITSIVGLLNWAKLPNYKSKLFLASIFLSAFTEFLGVYFTKWTGLLNYYVFNFYIFILFTLYYYILASIIKRYFYKIIASLFIFLYFLAILTSIIIFKKELGLGIFSEIYVLGVLFFIILSILYLLEFFNSNKVLNYSKTIFFWFVLGVLLFHVPFLPFMLSLEWFLIEYTTSIYSIIIFILSLIMNVCFVTGFIWTEKKYNY